MRKSIQTKYIKILLLSAAVLLISVLLSGCWDAKDINEKLIATAIAFDYKDGEIFFYVEFANIEAQTSKGGGESAGAKYTYLTAHGKTFPEARENLNNQIDKPLYLSGVRSLIMTESFANEYLVEYLYRFRGDETYRKKIETVITMEDPETIFQITNEKGSSVGFVVDEMIDTIDRAGLAVSRTTTRLLENLSSAYTGILISCIGMQEKEIALTGYSVVSGSKLVGFIPVVESKGMVFLKADKPEFSYVVPYEDLKFTIKVILNKRKITSSYENGEISFDIKLDFDAELMYGDKKTPYNFEDKAKKEVTGTLLGMLEKELTDAIVRARNDFETDYLQLDDEFRMDYPAEFEKMDWQNEFPKANVKIDVSVDLSTAYMMDYGAVDVK